MHLEVRKEKERATDKVFKSNTSTSRNPDDWAIIDVEEMTSHQ